jgi:hypothetical protein
MASLIDIKVSDLTDSQLRQFYASILLDDSLHPLMSEVMAELQTRKMEIEDREFFVYFKDSDGKKFKVQITKRGGVIKDELIRS